MNKPNPGSLEAIEAGCECPVLDNEHGAGCFQVDGEPMFWITGTCPIHGVEADNEQEK